MSIHPMLGAALLTVSLLTGQALASDGFVIANGLARQVPQEYIVEDGDTLWDICDEYFRDPWVWPSIWALNPHVTNPHWIYPDDVLRLRVPRGSVGPDGAPIVPISYTVGAQRAAWTTQNLGFIAEQTVKPLGVVSYSPERWEMVSDGNRVYLTFDDLDAVRIGDRYTVYKERNDVTHPETEVLVGRLIEVYAVVEVVSVEEEVARAKVVDAVQEFERGMFLMKALKAEHRVSPRQNLIDLEGVVIEGLQRVVELAQFHTIFLDRGSKDGVQVGNRFVVMRRGDGFLDLKEDTTAKLPWEQIGEALVVETHDRSCTAVITQAMTEVRRGDRVVLERHY